LRIAVGVEYAGEQYAGWQRQAHAPSVQDALERALERIADHPVRATAAGRTDAGVHALGQVVHFDTEARRELRGWVLGANTHLPADIALTFAAQVPENFHARYAALRRTYRYLLLNRPTRPAIASGRIAFSHRPLELVPMQEAARLLVGEHDFSAFRSSECQAKSAVRRLLAFEVARRGELVEFTVTANAFLHHMVRNLVGTLLAVGSAERPPAWVREVLEGRERELAGPTAEAAGLYFAGPEYAPEFGLPGAVLGPDSAIIPRVGAERPAHPRWPP
jgi:tRNA pseudouridine38-40 synthase